MPGTEYKNVDGTGVELFKDSHKARLREKKISKKMYRTRDIGVGSSLK